MCQWPWYAAYWAIIAISENFVASDITSPFFLSLMLFFCTECGLQNKLSQRDLRRELKEPFLSWIFKIRNIVWIFDDFVLFAWGTSKPLKFIKAICHLMCIDMRVCVCVCVCVCQRVYSSIVCMSQGVHSSIARLGSDWYLRIYKLSSSTKAEVQTFAKKWPSEFGFQFRERSVLIWSRVPEGLSQPWPWPLY